jgi:hypothetical protein
MRAALLVASLFTAALPAAADTPDSDVETAKRLYDAGREAHQAGKYLSAIHAFEGALKITRRPSVLFATAQAYRRQFAVDRDPARLRRALALYREVIAAVPDGSLRHQAAQHVEELQPLEMSMPSAAPGSDAGAPQATGTSLLMLYAPGRAYAGAVGSVDGSTPARLPLYLPVKPGKHTLRVEAPGYFPLLTDFVAP